MDKEETRKEFESLLLYNNMDMGDMNSGDNCEPMNLVELSSIAQDINSMLWFMHELSIRVMSDNVINVDVEAINILRRMSEDSYRVIEGLNFDDVDTPDE